MVDGVCISEGNMAVLNTVSLQNLCVLLTLISLDCSTSDNPVCILSVDGF